MNTVICKCVLSKAVAVRLILVCLQNCLRFPCSFVIHTVFTCFIWKLQGYSGNIMMLRS